MREPPSLVAARACSALTGISTFVLFVLLFSSTWFSSPWKGSYEFYGGGEGAFVARGYPVEITVRLIAILCLVLLGWLGISAARSLALHESAFFPNPLRGRVVMVLAVADLALVLSVLAFPPAAMVAFPPIRLCPGAYAGLASASVAAASASCSLMLSLSIAHRSGDRFTGEVSQERSGGAQPAGLNCPGGSCQTPSL